MAKKIKNHEGKPFSETKILDWFIQICLGLECLHNRGIIHRNINAQNILLTKAKIIKLGGLSIAKAPQNSEENLQKLHWLYPETINNMPCSYKSDIWAIGVVLYELCALRSPFEIRSLAVQKAKVAKGEYPPLPKHCSEKVKALIASILQVDPTKRPTLKYIINESVKIRDNIVFLKQSEMNRELANYEPIGVPADYICQITQELMRDPVVAADGHTYERHAIVHWFGIGNNTSPITRERLNDLVLINNFRLKAIIKAFQDRLPVMKRENQYRSEREGIIKAQENLIAEKLKLLTQKEKENMELKLKLKKTEEMLQMASEFIVQQPITTTPSFQKKCLIDAASSLVLSAQSNSQKKELLLKPNLNETGNLKLKAKVTPSRPSSARIKYNNKENIGLRERNQNLERRIPFMRVRLEGSSGKKIERLDQSFSGEDIEEVLLP